MVEPYEKDIEHPHIDTPQQGAAPCCRESKFALAGFGGNDALQTRFTSLGARMSIPHESHLLVETRQKRTRK